MTRTLENGGVSGENERKGVSLGLGSGLAGLVGLGLAALD